MNSSLLPQTDSIQKLAQFWDSHELTDFEDQLEEVKESVFKRESTVQIALQAREIEAVTEIANSKGIKSTELIREWIIERIETS
ncbi:MAG: hypothetical protein HOC74_42000 [Gemmatimonadetes bacterium]|jgi:predicted DNA binding CopG/RHH family protein|nr:hypothetical protein [Gemmatimonadota bacterium]